MPIIKAQDYLKNELGYSVSKCKNTLRNWKESYGMPIKSVKGKYGGTYLTNEQFDNLKEYIDPTANRVYGDKEHGALCAIEQLLGVKLIRQFKVGNYRVDGYCKETNTAYEIDEPRHFSKGELRQDCKERQSFVEKTLGCKFVRIKV